MSFEASIVIPLLNQVDDWLEQSVRSALRQSILTEVVVIRSQRTSASNQAILSRLQQQYRNLSVLVEDKPNNFPAAINQAIRHASAARVGLLLSDDWLDTTAIAECLQKTSDIVCTGNVVYFPNGQINERACKIPSIDEFNSFATFEEKASYLQHFFLFQKYFLLCAGGLDETIGNYPGVDDFDLIWTLLERGATVSIIQKPLYHYRDHEGERLTLKDPASAINNLKKILRKHGMSEEQWPKVIGKHALWYGKPWYKVMNDARSGVSVDNVSDSSGFVSLRSYPALMLQSNTGNIEPDRVVCMPVVHKEGHCLFGGDYLVTESSRYKVIFKIAIDAYHFSRDPLVVLDVYENLNVKAVLVERQIRSEDLAEKSPSFSVEFSANEGERVEFRVYWAGQCLLTAAEVILQKSTSQVEKIMPAVPSAPQSP